MAVFGSGVLADILVVDVLGAFANIATVAIARPIPPVDAAAALRTFPGDTVMHTATIRVAMRVSMMGAGPARWWTTRS